MFRILQILGRQEWIRYGIRYRIINFFIPINKVNKEFKIPFFEYTFEGNLKFFLDWIVYFFGAYEKSQLLWVKNFLLLKNKTGTCLDIGANLGNHSMFFSTFFSSVHSFEPFPPIFERLQKHIKSNRITNVSLHQLALSNSNKKIPFYPPQSNNVGMGTFDLNRINNPSTSLMFDVHNGDEFLEKKQISNIDFIKIDVEGHELEVFEGLYETIKSNQPYIWFEYTPSDDKSKKWIFNELLQGYSFYRLDNFTALSISSIDTLTREVDIFASPL